MTYKLGDVVLDSGYPVLQCVYVYIDETHFLVLRGHDKANQPRIEEVEREVNKNIFTGFKKEMRPVRFNLLEVLKNINLRDLTQG